MFINLVFSIIGLAALVFSADCLVKAASNLALNFGVSKMVIGLTIVAAGTSLPEFVVSVNSSIKGDPSLSLGNVVGSNIMNIALILGLTSIILPINSTKEMVKREVPIMIAVTALAWVLAKTDSKITPYEGILLLVIFIAYNVMSYIIGKREASLKEEYEEEADKVITKEVNGKTVDNIVEEKKEIEENTEKREENKAEENQKTEDKEEQIPSVGFNLACIIGGIVGMVLGSEFLVRGATNIAKLLGISNEIIGLTLVAIGTSLPELTTSIIAARKGQSDLSVGNVLGSNIFNITAIIGTAAFIPIFYSNADTSHFLNVSNEMLTLHIPIMMVVAVILLPIMLTDMKISRNEGLFFLGIYICYTIMLFQSTSSKENIKPKEVVQEQSINTNASSTLPLSIAK